MPGPAPAADREVLVSLTDYTAEGFHRLPLIWRDGYKLRRAWPDMDGAVGLWLWTLPRERRSGSLSVWTSEEALAGFIRWPPHIEIMDRHHDHGTMKPSSWRAERFDPDAVWTEALRRLEG
jgi:hypothetical protein